MLGFRTVPHSSSKMPSPKYKFANEGLAAVPLSEGHHTHELSECSCLADDQ